MQLCHFSKSELLASSILESCPLDLKATEAKKCPCRKREYHVPPADLRVLSCTFPETWNGQPIRDAAALKRNLTIEKKTSKRERSLPTMTTAATDTQELKPPANAIIPHKPATGCLSVYDKISDVTSFVNGFGSVLYDSKMFGLANVAQGKALAFMFLVKRIDPFDFRRRHHVIGGNVTLSAEAMLADFRTVHGGTHTLLCRTPEKASIELAQGRKKHTFEFTWAEALLEDYIYTKEANDGKTPKRTKDGSVNPEALKDNWRTPRRRMQMLWARVVSDAVGAMAPEVSGGQVTPEEMGVLSVEAMSEGIDDADFSVIGPGEKLGTPADPGEIVTVEPEPPFEVPSASSSAVPAQPTQATTPPASTAAAPSSPSQPVQPTMTTQLQVPPVDEQKKELLRELKALKEDLLTPEQYKAVMDRNYGGKTATTLTHEELTKLVVGLRARKQKRDQKDELSKWAENAGRNPAGGTPGN